MKMMIEMKFQSSFRWRLMCAARDVGVKMTQFANLIIIPVKAHMAKPCDAVAKILYKFQSSFRWRLMCAARDVGASMAVPQPPDGVISQHTRIREHRS
ncbi:MAG: hypothetical protein CVU26_02905 [Betaproteobacteria bacterium HGW-Betaproteobacteria-2]|nr:MAG: hypothetical protein CVU26_02905 [Betaproteobacteria bacterium HGW-Betaproteobacteria-2]